MSQDHLELFFGAIRSKGGFNNNPTARQFQAAYKHLLVQVQIVGSKAGNIADFGTINILNCTSITRSDEGDDLEKNDKFLEMENKISHDIKEYSFLSSDSWNLTLYAEDIVGYITGFIVRKLRNCLNCAKCLSLLESESVMSSLQQRKTYGRLVRASKLVIEICKGAEKFFRFYIKTQNIFNQNRNLLEILIVNTMNHMGTTVYDYFQDHLYDDDVLNGHAVLLVKLVLKHFFKLRLHYESNKLLEKSKPRIRSINNKVTLFRNE